MKNFTNWLVKAGCFVKGMLFCLVTAFAVAAWCIATDEEYAEREIKRWHPDVKGFRKKKDD